MVKILVSDKIHEDGINMLKEVGEVEVATGMRPEELIAKIKDFEVLVVRSATKVTKEVIAAGKNLKIIARAGVGLDNIDVSAAKERGITVISAPEAPTVAVAELTIGLMLSFARKIPRADAGMKSGKWEKKELMGTELRGKTLGIIGTGRIGKAVAQRARAFEMNLLFYDLVLDEDFARTVGARYVTLEELLKNSDFISIHVPLLPQTRHMIGEKEFQMMKSSAVIINTSRGEIIDEAALVNALKTGRIAGACLDVFEKEPPEGSPLLACPNIVLTPHIGASTVEAQREAAMVIAKKIKEAVKGG
ncbi:MAG: hydroxyacid dehydrogenase [Candidatus Hadarchaeales archaeon]